MTALVSAARLHDCCCGAILGREHQGNSMLLAALYVASTWVLKWSDLCDCAVVV